MIKLVATIIKKSDLSADQFIDYYENHHSRLVMRSVGRYFHKYVRSYVSEAYTLMGGDTKTSLQKIPTARSIDCITELWFKDDKDFAIFLSQVSEGGVWFKDITEDEAKFLDRSATQIFISENFREEDLQADPLPELTKTNFL